MPAAASGSSSMFGRFRRQHSGDNDGNNNSSSSNNRGSNGNNHASDKSSAGTSTPENATQGPTSPPLASPPLPQGGRVRSPREGHAKGHRRDSSLLSLTSSVKELGANVARSASLKSHRPQLSGGSSGHGHNPKSPSYGNLNASIMESSATDPLTQPASLTSSTAAAAAAQQYKAPPSRGKLGISARSFSQKIRSSDALHSFAEPDLPDRPPQTSAGETRTLASMLVPPQSYGAYRDTSSERPSTAAGLTSFSRPHAQHKSPGSTVAPTPLTIGYDAQGILLQIQETSAKRMATIDYLRKVHDGDLFYFNTLHYTPTTALPSAQGHKLGSRASAYLMLGYSLPSLMETHSSSAIEYLKAITALISEYETYQNLSSGDNMGGAMGRMGQMFKSSRALGARANKGRRASTATESLLSAASDSSYGGSVGLSGGGFEGHSPVLGGNHDFQLLITPHLPFDPDFNVAFSALCDALLEAYSKLLRMVSSPEACGPFVEEAFAKADRAVRKILVSNVVREFDENTRGGVKGEVAGVARLVLGGLM